MPTAPIPTLPPYEEMVEYILDAGKECSCCTLKEKCRGIVQHPTHPEFPECSRKDFMDLLGHRMVRKVYKEDHNL